MGHATFLYAAVPNRSFHSPERVMQVNSTDWKGTNESYSYCGCKYLPANGFDENARPAPPAIPTALATDAANLSFDMMMVPRET